MAQTSHDSNHGHTGRSRRFFERTNEELAQYIAELEKANGEIRNARRAALNLMEDALLSQEALRKSEERLHMAVEAGNIGTCDWNYFTGEMQWNEVRFRLYGMEPQDRTMHIEEFYAIVHPEDVEKTRLSITNGIENKGSHAEEYRVKHPDGKIHWIYEVGRVIERKREKPYRVISVLFDITERKKLEQQKEDFISIASHELKTPLTSIKAYTDLIQTMHDDGDHEAAAPLIGQLNANVDRLIELVHTLLDVSTMTMGELPLRRETFSLRQLIEECSSDLARLSYFHSIKIQSESDLVVTADRERIGQVLNNLISNAMKYSPNGGNITINCRQRETDVEVSVQDEGIGIAEQAQTKIFDRFFREETIKTKNFRGMGLGLYIAADIIHRHRGKIWVESKPGDGSTFHFTLPAKK